MSGSMTAQAQGPTAEGSVSFDLPAQALAPAIEAYSVASGWQVIYDSGLAAGRQSAPVKGRYPPVEALRLLLAGTGLAAQVMAADGAMLIPDPLATRSAAPLAPAAPLRDYYGRIQTGLKRAFCADEQIRSGGHRIALGLWIGAGGTVSRVEPLGSTGQSGLDAAFDRAVRRLSFGQAVPAGFEQPVVILVTPDLLAQCNVAGAQPAGAATR